MATTTPSATLTDSALKKLRLQQELLRLGALDKRDRAIVIANLVKVGWITP